MSLTPPNHFSPQGAPSAADRRTDDVGRAAAWACFHQSIADSLHLWPGVHPMPATEEQGDSMIRAMQRARRYTWLHARHVLGWSMFESIRISVRLAEVFGGWTREARPELGELARRLERMEGEARHPYLVRLELRFVDQLMESAVKTDLPLADMELALDAYERTEAAERLAAAG